MEMYRVTSAAKRGIVSYCCCGSAERRMSGCWWCCCSLVWSTPGRFRYSLKTRREKEMLTFHCSATRYWHSMTTHTLTANKSLLDLSPRGLAQPAAFRRLMDQL